jgi:large subunit ribosomal protein L5e
MAFVKLYKNKAYFMRYQTKYRRRREGKTDYYTRKRLITQDKDKYNTQKYRLVARITNYRVIAQVVHATITGDKIFCQADSLELRKYGLSTGFASYSAGYATGLLLARRVLKKLGMDGLYSGVDKTTGEDYDVNKDLKEDQRRPFKCVLDVGLRPTTTGNRVFSILKGAIDGGLDVPHGVKRFPGYKVEDGEGKEDHKFHLNRIMGGHIDSYMKKLKGKPEYTKQFKLWDECLKNSGAASVEALFAKIHTEIRKNPDFAKKAAKKDPKRDHAKFRQHKITLDERRKRVAKKIEIFMKKELKKSKKEK